MSVNRIAGVIVFLVGAFLGASTRTNIWDRFPFWVWIVILIVALAICGAGVELWHYGYSKTKKDSSDNQKVN